MTNKWDIVIRYHKLRKFYTGISLTILRVVLTILVFTLVAKEKGESELRQNYTLLVLSLPSDISDDYSEKVP
jgi:hypothetical protein